MPDVTITTDPQQVDALADGTSFTLTAEPAGATSYAWTRGGKPAGTERVLSETASKDTVGRYAVAVTLADGTTGTADAVVGLAETTAPDPAPAETPAAFHPLFAIVSALVVTGIGVAVLLDLASTVGDLTRADLLGASGDRALAASIAAPMAMLGGALVLLGAWLAAVDWRGRFAATPQGQRRGLLGDLKPSELIAEVGKLRGAALVLVVGAVLLLGSAWAVRPATEASDEPDATTTSTTATPPG